MKLRLLPAALGGSVRAIASKSDVHRLLICAALSDAPTQILAGDVSDDIDATVRCLRAMGAEITRTEAGFAIVPPEKPADAPCIDCGESGSTLRFLLPVSASLCTAPHFTGAGRLPQRPIGALLTALAVGGVRSSASTLPLTLHGTLQSGSYALPGNISSQYITGLLLALPRLAGTSRITLTSPLESASYIQLTLAALARFGVRVSTRADGWTIPGGQVYHAQELLRADGDWSNAAFFLAAGALGGKVTVEGLAADSPQGDKAIVPLLRRFGAQVEQEEGRVSVCTAPLRGCNIDLADVPDLLPVLAVVAAFATGETHFYGGARLRLKESDRLQSVCALLLDLGGDARLQGDELTVYGGRLTGGRADSCNDHRIAMAAAIAATRTVNAVTLQGAEAVNKSYPAFFKDYAMLGGNAHVI